MVAGIVGCVAALSITAAAGSNRRESPQQRGFAFFEFGLLRSDFEIHSSALADAGRPLSAALSCALRACTGVCAPCAETGDIADDPHTTLRPPLAACGFFVESEASWESGSLESLARLDGDFLILRLHAVGIDTNRRASARFIWSAPQPRSSDDLVIHLDAAGSHPRVLQLRDWKSNCFVEIEGDRASDAKRYVRDRDGRVDLRVVLEPRGVFKANDGRVVLDHASILLVPRRGAAGVAAAASVSLQP